MSGDGTTDPVYCSECEEHCGDADIAYSDEVLVLCKKCRQSYDKCFECHQLVRRDDLDAGRCLICQVGRADWEMDDA